MRAALPLLLFALLLSACGEAAETGASSGAGGSGGTGAPGSPQRYGGPLASAGADQRVLEGMPVRLDGRASLPGEEGLPISYVWVQEAGPRVVLDDPTSSEPWFVAPPVRSREGTRLVFRLTVTDGDRRSSDRVAVDLVEPLEGMLPPPVAVADADLAVRPGATVNLGAPFTLDPACLDLGGAAGCERLPLPFAWTQVDVRGEPVALDGDTFVAPAFDTVLTFRLDATRSGDPATCGAAGPLDGASFCSAPDYVRVIVDGTSRRLATAPVSPLLQPAPIAPAGGLVRLTDADGLYPQWLTVRGTTEQPADSDLVATFFSFHPLLGGGPRGASGRPSQELLLERSVAMPDGRDIGGWPRTVAVSFQTRAGRLFSRPTPVVARWEPPDRGALPIADAGENPCARPFCRPFLGGDVVTLDGSASRDPDTAHEDLTFCWWQTLGPQVSFLEGPACLRGEPNRTFVAPEAPAGGTAMQLAFLLTVGDGGELLGPPDTALVQIRPADNEPPEVVTETPPEVDEGDVVLLDASGSFDPEGSALAFFWVQRPREGAQPVALRQAACGAPPGACMEFTAPSVTRDTVFAFEAVVSDEAPLSASRTVEILVRNSQNDPPIVDAGSDVAVAPGAQVELTGSARDPNPGDDETLAFGWRILAGDVVLDQSAGPVVRFRAPTSAVDRDLTLELTVADGGGAVGTDQIVVSVLANGPYVAATGDDAAHGSMAAPVATIARGIEIAGQNGLGRVHVGAGTFAAPPSALAAIAVRGGHDPANGWAWPADAETVIETAGALELGPGAVLEQLVLRGGAEASELVRVTGDASGVDVVLDGAALAADGAATVRVETGTFVATRATIAGPAAARDGGGLACAAGAQIDLQSAALSGGGGPGAHAAVSLASGCGAAIRDSSLVGGSGGAEAVGLWARGGAPLTVERSSLEGGSAGLSIGARLRAGLVQASTLRGGDGAERMGLEVPAGVVCGAPPCVTIEGGTIAGGAGPASGSAVGVRALAPVALVAVESIVGADGHAQTATGVQLLGGGSLQSVASVRAIEGGTAVTAIGLIAGGGVTIEDGGDLLGGDATGDAIGLEVRGPVSLDRVLSIAGSAASAANATGIRVAPVGSLVADRLLRVDGGPATGTSRGVEVAAGGTLQLANALIFAGPAPIADGVRVAGDTALHSSLVRVRSAGTRSSALQTAGGSAALRNVILDAGPGPDRAHVREASGGLPAVLARVLFVTDTGCGSGGAYVRTAAGAVACSVAGMRALGAGWDPLVGDPVFVDAGAGDYRLAAGSPAIDAGTTDAAPAFDALGFARGGDGNGDGVAGPDIGPFER